MQASEKKQIVILDSLPLCEDGSMWESFKELAKCRFFLHTSQDQIVDRAKDADVILTNKVKISSEEIEKLPKLRYIGLLATGYNNIDIEAAKKRGITVTNVPSYGTSSVAQHTFSLILELTNHVGLHSALVKKGVWSDQKAFSFWERPLGDLEGKTLGIIGYGKIGQRVAEIAKAFHMKLLIHSISGKKGFNSLDDLLRKSDIVSLHCMLSDQTRALINKKTLSLMKKEALLINTSRGELIDEKALYEALESGKLQGAALDVLSEEPPPKENPLLSQINCIITPHIAWASVSSRRRLIQTVYENLKNYFENKTNNKVN